MPENHEAAELYEVALTKMLSDELQVATNVTSQIYRAKLEAAGDKAQREIDRVTEGCAVLRTHIFQLQNGVTPDRIEWCGGGTRSSEGTAADIRVHFLGIPVPISYQVKSVGEGFGTLRNPYAETLMVKMGGSAQDLIDEALTACSQAFTRLTGIATGGVSAYPQLQRLRKSLPEDARTAEIDRELKRIYSPYKRKLCMRFAEVFNGLEPINRTELLCGLMGIVLGEPLYLLTHDNHEVRILSHEALADTIRQEVLTTDVLTSGNSVKIRSDDCEYFRMNSSASNKQGSSQPCWRLFYGTGAIEKLTRE